MSLIWLLLLSRSSHLAADTVASARVSDVTSTTCTFTWTEPPSLDLQHILLKATPTSGNGASVEAQISPKIGHGRLENLEPFTYYDTSVTYVPADSSAQHVARDTGSLRTWSGAPSPPTLTSAVSTGARSISVSWSAPTKPNGNLKDYLAACYRPGDQTPTASKRVTAETFSAELISLPSDRPYECEVTATTKEFNWGQGGGTSVSGRSSLVQTWPGTTEQPSYKYATARGSHSAFLEWRKPNTIYGILDHYSVTMAPNDHPDSEKDIKTKNDTLKLLVLQLQSNTKYKFTLRAHVLPNGQGQGGGYSIPSVAGYVTTLVEGASASVQDVDSSVERYDWESGAASSVIEPAARQ